MILPSPQMVVIWLQQFQMTQVQLKVDSLKSLESLYSGNMMEHYTHMIGILLVIYSQVEQVQN